MAPVAAPVVAENGDSAGTPSFGFSTFYDIINCQLATTVTTSHGLHFATLQPTIPADGDTAVSKATEAFES
jgi:hypothetical protein